MFMKVEFKILSEIVFHEFLYEPTPNSMINEVVIDSRSIAKPTTTLFVVMKGKRLDGFQFIQEAYDKGVRNFIVDKYVDTEVLKDINYMVVTNPVKALQQIAQWYRQQFDIPVIGITGSNGKTIVKEWLFQLLEKDYDIVRSPRSYNSQIGVPLSILLMEKHHNLAIFEAGISEVGEMQALANIIQCNIGVFTNIGDAHNEGFSSMQEKIAEKVKLFQNCDICIYNKIYNGFEIEKKNKNKDIGWSVNDNFAKIHVSTNKKIINQTTDIEAIYSGNRYFFSINFCDDASIENAIHCFCVMLHLGYDNTTIRQRMALLQPVELRLEMKAGIYNSLIINDAYSLDITSLSFALDFMQQQSQLGKKTLILSDVLQSGQSRELLYDNIAQLIAQKNIDKLIAIGTEIEIIKAFLPHNIQYTHYEKVEDFLLHTDFKYFQNETILLKGARVYAFERIAAQLELKAHRTVLEINLDALRHNLVVYTKRLNEGTKILVMVKASAYGSGSAEVAKLLAYHKVDYLGVAYTDEAITLRREGIKLPIMVLNVEEASFRAAIEYDIEPEIYSIPHLKSLLPYIVAINKPLKIHLKLDTGMRRLGFESQDLAELVALLTAHPMLYVQSIFSHLAASDSAEHDDFSSIQVERFLTMYEYIAANIGYRPMRHICNTGGIIRFPQYHFEMVRLGIGIYGVDSSQAIQPELQVVNTLKAHISQIKHLKAGETVGYSRRGRVARDSRIATISIGYADGLLRAAGNGRYQVAIKGQLAPIIGSVCMDMCMIDITALENIEEGDEVIVFGNFPRVETLAEATDTIAYEIFTNISERVKRVYFKEG
jgi:Alr-MurF fusion protein